MPTPHVHAEQIKAWADGAEIEYFDLYAQDWVYRSKPTWDTNGQYRIKPVVKPSSTCCVCNKVAKVTRWLWAYKFPQDTQWTVNWGYRTEEEFRHYTTAKGIKLEWSAMEFDE